MTIFMMICLRFSRAEQHARGSSPSPRPQSLLLLPQWAASQWCPVTVVGKGRPWSAMGLYLDGEHSDMVHDQ